MMPRGALLVLLVLLSAAAWAPGARAAHARWGEARSPRQSDDPEPETTVTPPVEENPEPAEKKKPHQAPKEKPAPAPAPASTPTTGLPTPEAVVAQGRMRGTMLLSRSGRPIHAFRGIPYAEPPVGLLRFQAPVAAGPWEGVLDASKDGSECVQKNYLVLPYPVTGNENCLFINVYTPKMAPPFGLYPVMVYIHGGGFFAGNGGTLLLGPEYLLEHDVVLVTMNYRLGALGFLSTGSPEAPGNAGLKDQALALRWVQTNIAAFGGDPSTVTIFGQSAGAASVHFHILSPMSQGLFHRAISQSGSALAAWAKPIPALPQAQRQAEFAGCPSDSPAAIVECLRDVDAHNLTESGRFFHFWDIDPLTAFRPVVEGAGETSFLPDDPLTIMQLGSFAQVPWLSGVVTEEGIIRAVPIVTNSSLVADLQTRWDMLMPRLMELDHSGPPQQAPALWRNISRFYFGDTRPQQLAENETQRDAFIRLYTDRSFIHAFHKTAELHARAGHKSLYLYEFAYRGNLSYSNLFSGGDDNWGVSHCDELIYLFYAPFLFIPPSPDTLDERMVHELTTMWVNFAKYGNPTPKAPSQRGARAVEPDASDGDSSVERCASYAAEVPWEPYDPPPSDYTLRFLRMDWVQRSGDRGDLRFCMKRGFHQRRVAFWDALPLSENKLTAFDRFLLPIFYLVGVLF